MRGPDDYDIDHLQRFFAGEQMNPGNLNGLDARTWGSFEEKESYSKELVVLKARGGVDSFSRHIISKANDIRDKFAFLKPRKPDPDIGLVVVADAKIFKTTF